MVHVWVVSEKPQRWAPFYFYGRDLALPSLPFKCRVLTQKIRHSNYKENIYTEIIKIFFKNKIVIYGLLY